MILTPLEMLGRLAHLVTSPCIHKHRYCGVLAPIAKLRRAVIERTFQHIGEPTEAPAVLPSRAPPPVILVPVARPADDGRGALSPLCR